MSVTTQKSTGTIRSVLSLPDPKHLAALGEQRLQWSEERLVDALTGSPQPMHRELLRLQLERLQLIDEQIARLNGLIAGALKPH